MGAILIAGWALGSWPWLPVAAQRVLSPWAFIFVCSLLWLPAIGRDGSGVNYLEELLTCLAVLCSAVLWLKRARWIGYGMVAISIAEAAGWNVVIANEKLPRAFGRYMLQNKSSPV